MKQEELKLGVIGLGYVGLPLAAEFGTSTASLVFIFFATGSSTPTLATCFVQVIITLISISKNKMIQ